MFDEDWGQLNFNEPAMAETETDKILGNRNSMQNDILTTQDVNERIAD